MITKVDLNAIRMGSFLTIMNNVRDYLAKENVQELGLEAIKNEFSASVDSLTELFKSHERGSKHTEKLTQLDNQRDRALVGFIKHVELFAKFPEEDKAIAASDLARIVKKYGKSPQLKPFNEETGIIIGLLAELSDAESKAKIALIGATPWISVLTTANAEFAELSKERVYESAGVEVGATKTARSKTYEVFKKLVKTINSLAFLNGEDKYKRLADNINKELANNK